jgi:hypothetical protein
MCRTRDFSISITVLLLLSLRFFSLLTATEDGELMIVGIGDCTDELLLKSEPFSRGIDDDDDEWVIALLV